jgi:hypothetical protein
MSDLLRTYLDPTGERSPAARPRAPRVPLAAGVVVGLVDIGKPRGDVFLDRLAGHLESRGLRVVRMAKPTFTKPAPLDLRQRIAADCQVVIQALAD